jgi:hypothetical protein
MVPVGGGFRRGVFFGAFLFVVFFFELERVAAFFAGFFAAFFLAMKSLLLPL